MQKDILLPALLFVVGVVLGGFVHKDLSLPLGLVGVFLGIYFTYAGFKAWVDNVFGGFFL